MPPNGERERSVRVGPFLVENDLLRIILQLLLLCYLSLNIKLKSTIIMMMMRYVSKAASSCGKFLFIYYIYLRVS